MLESLTLVNLAEVDLLVGKIDAPNLESLHIESDRSSARGGPVPGLSWPEGREVFAFSPCTAKAVQHVTIVDYMARNHVTDILEYLYNAKELNIKYTTRANFMMENSSECLSWETGDGELLLCPLLERLS